MVIDTSAIVAILFGEPEAESLAACIAAAERRLLSVVTRVELTCVLEGRKREAGRADLEALLREIAPDLVAVTAQQCEIAIDGFRRFGKGRHRAALNIGDCFTYALAKHARMPVLFKGDDFIYTDVQSALTQS